MESRQRISQHRTVKILQQGMKTHWRLFNERVVHPILTAQEPPALGQLCHDYGITDPQTASNMIVTVKRRFHTALKENVRRTLLEGEKTTEEIEELFRFFPKSAPDSH